MAVGRCADENDFEPVDCPLLGEIADQHLRFRIEIVGDDVQIAVIIKIKDDGGSACFGHGDDKFIVSSPADRLAQAQVRQHVVKGAVHDKLEGVGLLPWLDPENKFGIEKFLAPVVQQH
jgi:hypothetical protein